MTPDDTAKRRRQAERAVADDWRVTWRRITGEPYSTASLIRSTHRDDLRKVVRALVTAERTKRLDVAYRVRDASGQYTKVRWASLFLFGDWVGVIEPVSDWPNMLGVIPFHHKN